MNISRPNYSHAADFHYVFVVYEVSPDSLHSITERSIVSDSLDVKAALLSNGIPVFDEDRISTSPDAMGNIGGVITLRRAPVVNIIDAKKTKVIRTWQKTVADVLTEQKIAELGKEDTITPTLTTAIEHNMKVQIVRVQETDITETTVVAYTTVTVNDETRYRGEADVVTQEGKNGSVAKTYHIRREDGVEVSRVLLKTETVVMVKKIISHPVKLKIGRTLLGRATWYNSRYQAASHVFAKGTRVRVTNPANGKSLETVIEDYMESDQSVIDLKLSLFAQLADPYGTMPKLKVEEILN